MSSAAALSTDAKTSYISEYDAIVETMNQYNEGIRTGSSAAMKPSFHEACTFFGFYQGTLLAGPIQMLFDWVDANGPSEGIRTRYISIDIAESIATVRTELENMTGTLAGSAGAHLSDMFQLIKVDGKWLISQKSFHWH